MEKWTQNFFENSTLGQEFEFFLQVQMIGLDSFNINIWLARIKKFLLNTLCSQKMITQMARPTKQWMILIFCFALEAITEYKYSLTRLGFI